MGEKCTQYAAYISYMASIKVLQASGEASSPTKNIQLLWWGEPFLLS
jgi:hypothetical protein